MSTIEKEEYAIEPLETIVNSDKTNIAIEQNNELEVTGHKKEYSIVGDGLYAGISSESAPTWLTSIIDNVVNSLISKRVKDLDTAINNINKSLLELEVAKNQYQELINIDSRIDSVLTSKLETLNATIQQNSANIIGLDIAKVTPDEALAISIDHVNAQINNGDIHALVTEINSTIANNEISAAERIESLETVYNENESTVRNILSNSVGEYTATANAITELEVNINDELYGATGLENTLKGEITDEGARVESKFAYNSVLKLNGTSYSSGFGIATSLTSGSGLPTGQSEFWIKADKFKLMSADGSKKSSYSPFTVDSVTGEINFNGKVTFSNVTGTATHRSGTSSPTLGATTAVEGSTYYNTSTKSGYIVSNGSWINNSSVTDTSGLALKDMSNVTTIDGGKITTGKVSTDRLNVNDIMAKDMTFTGKITGGSGGLGGIIQSYNGKMKIDLVNGSIYIQ